MTIIRIITINRTPKRVSAVWDDETWHHTEEEAWANVAKLQILMPEKNGREYRVYDVGPDGHYAKLKPNLARLL